jgi:CRISPR/Cas system-associated endonuclease/helicase Cas3
MCIYKYMLNVYKNQQNRQTGSRNLMDPKMLPTIWGTYMKLVTKYQISAINSCWEKCDKKCAYMFNVYKNQLSRQTGSRNLMGPKTLPTIWYTYMMLVTKYQISAINSYWEKCAEKYFERTARQTDRGKTAIHLKGIFLIKDQMKINFYVQITEKSIFAPSGLFLETAKVIIH